jgi:hypothetical protein
MSEISIHIHPILADRLLADRDHGPRVAASLARQAIEVVQASGRRIAYAPVALPGVGGCAMSAHGGARGVVVVIDPPGTAIPGRGVVVERERSDAPRRGRQPARL